MIATGELLASGTAVIARATRRTAKALEVAWPPATKLRTRSRAGGGRVPGPRVSGGRAPGTSAAPQPEAGSPVGARSDSASAGCAEAELCSGADDATAAPLQGSTPIIARISLGQRRGFSQEVSSPRGSKESRWGRACRLGRFCLSHPQLDSRPVPYLAWSAGASKSQPGRFGSRQRDHRLPRHDRRRRGGSTPRFRRHSRPGACTSARR
jgi:hypothetical protein